MTHQTQDQPASAAAEVDVTCCICGDHVPPGQGYSLGPRGDVLCRLRCALRYPPLVRKAVRVALVVGTALTLINQGDLIMYLEFSAPMVVKALLTYGVPFSVAIYSALSIARR